MRVDKVIIPAFRFISEHDRLTATVFKLLRAPNPFSPQVLADPYSYYSAGANQEPVVFERAFQRWLARGYDEIRELMAFTDTSSAAQIERLLDVRPYNKLNGQAQFLLTNFLLFLDPPEHERIRRLVSRAFTPRRVAELEPSVARLATDLAAGLGDDREVELVDGFNVPLPIQVVATMLGIDEELWPWARANTAALAPLLEPLFPFDVDEMNDAADDVFRVYGALADDRRAEPRDDLLTALVQAADGSDRLTNEELATNVALLMGAGFETTSGALGNSVLALTAFPEQRKLLDNDPELWPNAVEELLRYDSPIKLNGRQMAGSIKLGDVEVPGGAGVTLSLAAGNRDPRRFDNPNRLDVTREDPRPLSFGHGIHYCLGAALARMELRVGLPALLDHLGPYEVAHVEWKRSALFRNQQRLVVRRTGDL